MIATSANKTMYSVTVNGYRAPGTSHDFLLTQGLFHCLTRNASFLLG